MVLSSNLRLFGKFYNFIFMSIFTQISSIAFENYLQKVSQCLKIREKVSFNIASEASGQKFFKNGKFGNFFKT